jgi:hypothetical protein
MNIYLSDFRERLAQYAATNVECARFQLDGDIR